MLGIGAYPLSSERVFEIYLGPSTEPKMKNSIAPPSLVKLAWVPVPYSYELIY
jgi:hypothetical protein